MGGAACEIVFDPQNLAATLSGYLATAKRLSEKQKSRIYADMDGTVKKMKEVDANQYSKEGETIYYLTGGETKFQASTANCAGVEEGGEYVLVLGNITYKVRLEKIEEGTKGKKDLYFSLTS